MSGNIEFLRSERMKAGSTMSSIAEASRGRSMTVDEQLDFDAAFATVTRIDKDIAATEQTAAPPPPTAADHTKALQTYAREQAGLPPVGTVSGRDIARASMARLLASGAADGAAAADTSTGAGLAKASMARQLKNARAG